VANKHPKILIPKYLMRGLYVAWACVGVNPVVGLFARLFGRANYLGRTSRGIVLYGLGYFGMAMVENVAKYLRTVHASCQQSRPK